MDLPMIHNLEHGAEVALEIAGGAQIRSGHLGDDSNPFSGSYVRVVLPDGRDGGYWHADEWQDDPVGVMRAILLAASQP